MSINWLDSVDAGSRKLAAKNRSVVLDFAVISRSLLHQPRIFAIMMGS
jgi:hypothetical protein